MNARSIFIVLSLAVAADVPAAESSKYLDAVREFADNVLKYGRDTYGPKHTPLFVDGLNIHTHEPVKWKHKGETVAEQCLASGRKPIVEMLIAKGADTSTITMSAYLGNLPGLKRYVENRSRQEILKEEGFDLLIAATTGGRIEVVTYLLDHRVAMARKDSQARTALHIACKTGNKRLVELLVSRGSDVNADNWTPLKEAVWNGNEDIARFLMSRGADINKGPTTALHNAVSWGDTDAAKLLLELGADTNIKDPDGCAPLHYAWRTEIIDLLLSHGANIDAKDNEGNTPLHWSVGYEPVARVLIEKGADIHAKDNEGKTPIDMALEQDGMQIVRLLETKGAKASDGRNMLHRAAANSTAQEFEALFTQALDISLWDAKDRNGFTPLHCAIHFWQIGNSKLLIDKGADVNVQDNEGYTPLHLAAWQGMNDMVQLLIDRGANLNTQDNWGWTPLHRAVIAKQQDIAKLLVEKGADTSIKDKEGRTALWWAEDLGLTDSLEFLKQVDQNGRRVGIVTKAKRSQFIHDVAITDISAPSTCKQGETVPVTVTVANQGTRRETFHLTLTEETSGKVIANKELALAKGWKDGSEGVADQTFTCPDPGISNFGDQFTTGDVNNDGYDDLLVGAPRWKNNTFTGRAYLYYGGAEESMDNIPDKMFAGENIGDRFSDSGIVIADMNKDGYGDVLLNARAYNDITGRVYIYWGGRDMDVTPDIVIDGECPLSQFGKSISVGDLNNDGELDLVVGANRYNNYQGRVYLYYGPITSDTTVDKVFTGENRDDAFGHQTSARGDVDGDGCDDLLVGTMYYPRNTGDGRAYLYYGDPGTKMNTVCDVYFDAENPGDQMGSFVDLFDIDNDGKSEVLITAREYGNSDGRGYLYWGEKP